MDRRYVGDITYIATWEGWAYLATVIDLASRRVVGWALADHMRTGLRERARNPLADPHCRPRYKRNLAGEIEQAIGHQRLLCQIRTRPTTASAAP